MPEFKNITFWINGPIAKIQFNRPKKKNAISPQMHQEISDAISKLERMDGVKVLILTGSSDSFCAGMDLEKYFLEPYSNPEELVRVKRLASSWYIRLRNLPAVSIAAVNGWCFGGGVCIAAICDIVIAAEEAIFGLSEVNFGLFPGGGTMWAVAKSMNRKQALYFSLTGETFDGRKAVELGLATRAVPLNKLEKETKRLADVLVRKNKFTLPIIKDVFEKSIQMNFQDSIDWELAKEHELTYESGASWVKKGLTQFKNRKYRPGFESYQIGKDE